MKYFSQVKSRFGVKLVYREFSFLSLLEEKSFEITDLIK